MSDDDDYAPEGSSGIQPMLLFRSGASEYNVMMGRGLSMRSYTSQERGEIVGIEIGSYGKYGHSVDINMPARLMEPRDDESMSLIDKVRLRFNLAARMRTDVDLRFCTGEEKTRNPAHDTLVVAQEKGLYRRSLG